MMYQAYQFQDDLIAPLRWTAEGTLDFADRLARQAYRGLVQPDGEITLADIEALV